ncbi:MAG: hypothetical protein ACYDGR_08910, partial [Candidatus Dormibacteria bacterium]
MTPGSPVTDLKGVSELFRKRLEKVGVKTVGDLLLYLPRRYEDFSSIVAICFLQEGKPQTVKARVEVA